ncbi:MAG: hypothetical protein OXG15_00995 [Gammaproteobacteria bacterium]|nr:hypothetical protein [Gammaproteobacteria bacterium]
MRTSVAIIISMVVGTLFGGLIAGVSVYVWSDQDHPAQISDLNVRIPDAMRDSTSISPAIARERFTGDLNSSLRVRTVHGSTQFASDFDQSVSLYLLLSGANKRDLEKYISESFSISSRNQRVAALSIIFGRYAALDPSEALTRALALSPLTAQERSNLVRSIFNEWTVADLDAAVAAIEELPQPFKFTAASAVVWRSDDLTLEQRRQLTQRVGPTDAWISHTLNNIEMDELKHNPRQAYYDRIRDSTHTRESNSALLGIARHWFELEGVSVLEEIHDSLDNSQARNFVLTNLIWNAVGSGTAEPSEILEVASGFDNKQTAKQAMEYVFQSWSNTNPRDSFEASLEYDDQLVTHEFRSSLLQRWAVRDAEDLLVEATSLPTRYRDTAIAKALGGMSLKSPDEAIRYARTLDSHKLRMSARDEILKQWSTVDAKSAFEWLLTDDLSGNSPPDLSRWHRTFWAYLTQDFESAKTFATNHQGELREHLIESVAGHLVRSDVKRAIEYLPNVEKTYRPNLQNQIGSELARMDPFEALKYASQVAPAHRFSYFNTVLNAWAQMDMVSLHDNISQVPSKYRSEAARVLLRVDGRKNLLSDREIKSLEEMVANDDDFIATSE